MIYIVSGSTGEYSDRSEWLVAAYTDRAVAQKHVDDSEEWFRVNIPQLGKWPHYGYEDREKKNPYDPKMSVDYTGAHWFLQEVELVS